MDDVKLFARNRREPAQMIEVTRDVSEAIGMELGPAKCATAMMEKGRLVATEDIRISSIHNLLGEQAYRYLRLARIHRTNKDTIRMQ